MDTLRRLARQTRLRHLLFVLLVFSGLIPVVVSTSILIEKNRDTLRTQEKAYLTRSALALSREIDTYLATVRRELVQLGEGFLAQPLTQSVETTEGELPPEPVQVRLQEPWVERYFSSYVLNQGGEIVSLRALDVNGFGSVLGSGSLGESVIGALDETFEAVKEKGQPVYRFLVLEGENEPVAVLGVPVDGGSSMGSEPVLILEAVVRLHLLEQVFRREAAGEAAAGVEDPERRSWAVFLVDREGQLLWSEGSTDVERRFVPTTEIVSAFVQRPLPLTGEYRFQDGDRDEHMLAQVSPIDETGWGVVVRKPVAAAFKAVQDMVRAAVLSTLLLVLVSMAFAGVVSRALSSPIQTLAETTHQIAAGGFGKRVQVPAIGAELRELAEDFNRMSGKIQRYVEQLKSAAAENRDQFISSIRAFAAAIDAKDPYTRGHSERVASYSRTIARSLGLAEEFQERIWIAGVLHDVGKIGIEDRILKKGGVLTSEEYEVMKSHTVIGAEILAPIHQLKEMIPAVRWHHEAWNGRGYPDGLKGEAIPLMARIVGVADTFDAITTNRPYQKAYTPEFAVETITKLTGKRFDAKVVTAFLRAFEGGEVVVPKAEPEEAQPVSVPRRA